MFNWRHHNVQLLSHTHLDMQFNIQPWLLGRVVVSFSQLCTTAGLGRVIIHLYIKFIPVLSARTHV